MTTSQRSDYGRNTKAKFRAILSAALLVAVSTFSHPSDAAPIVYSAFPGEPASTAFSSVTVSGVSVGVRRFFTAGNPAISYSRFAMPHTAHTVVITASRTVSTCTVKPASYGITTTKSGSTCTFILSAPRKLRVFINNLEALYIFADSPEAGAPQLGQPYVYDVTTWAGIDNSGVGNSTTGVQAAIDAVSSYNNVNSVLYFKNGKYRVGGLRMKNKVKLYLKSGAVISGTTAAGDYAIDAEGQRALILFNGVSTAAIQGRGVIHGDGMAYRVVNCPSNTRHACWDAPNHATAPAGIRVLNSSGITVKDVYMMDPGWWTNFIHSSNNVTYDGVKIITEKAVFNGDGVDVDSSTNVTVKNVFVHNGDDAFCVKTKDLLGIKGPSNNVRFENNVIGYSLRAAKIGTETVAGGNMTNITFKNFESVQLAQHNAIITVQDGNTVDGVTFDSLKVDSGKKPFILEIKKRNASSSVGLIRNVWLKNLSVPAVTENSPINGYDSAHKIKTVTICNFKKGGVVKTTLGTAGIVPNTFTTGVTISGTCP